MYTGTGDRGKTSLFSGERVDKDRDRVDAYGDVDELNSALGFLLTLLPEDSSETMKDIQAIQSNLFHMGAWLATSPDSPLTEFLSLIGEEHIKALEDAVDRLNEGLPPLKHFVVPGGHSDGAWAHMARTICRRVERHVVHLSPQYTGAERVEDFWRAVTYLNRLSDYLFVLARHCNRRRGVGETIWKK